MIILDAEMSGLDYRKHSLVSIGAVDFENPERRFYAEPRIWENAELDLESLAVNGFTKEECLDPNRKSLEEVAKGLYEWAQPIKNKTLVGQNPSGDRQFTNDAFSRAGIGWGFCYRTIDLHTVAYIDHLRRGLKIELVNDRTTLNLDTILKYVGMPSEPKPHNALNGAMLEAEALSRILNGKNLLPEYEKYPVPETFL